jgi:hypothetical protein
MISHSFKSFTDIPSVPWQNEEENFFFSSDNFLAFEKYFVANKYREEEKK